MSKATKRKHVQKELLSREYTVPEDINQIVRIKTNAGNNLHQISTHTGEEYFVSMPGKFRNNIWIKPGDYVTVKPIEEGNKVRAEIDEILDKAYIHYLKSANSWPFHDAVDKESIDEKSAVCDKDSDEELGGGNLNRRPQVVEFSSSEEE